MQCDKKNTNKQKEAGFGPFKKVPQMHFELIGQRGTHILVLFHILNNVSHYFCSPPLLLQCKPNSALVSLAHFITN